MTTHGGTRRRQTPSELPPLAMLVEEPSLGRGSIEDDATEVSASAAGEPRASWVLLEEASEGGLMPANGRRRVGDIVGDAIRLLYAGDGATDCFIPAGLRTAAAE